MDPYAKPRERKVGAPRPKVSHLPRSIDRRTRKERQAEKQAVATERRAIKKSARRHLKQQLLDELENICGSSSPSFTIRSHTRQAAPAHLTGWIAKQTHTERKI